MSPLERLTPWKDSAIQLMEPHKITDNQFIYLGKPRVSYIKLKALNGKTLICVYSADGELLLQDIDFDKTVTWVTNQQLIPVALN